MKTTIEYIIVEQLESTTKIFSYTNKEWYEEHLQLHRETGLYEHIVKRAYKLETVESK